LLDTGKINQLGWYPKIDLEEGIQAVCRDYANESRGIESVRSYTVVSA
jgi:dTDP-D-glucose 4,6-dehydratase